MFWGRKRWVSLIRFLTENEVQYWFQALSISGKPGRWHLSTTARQISSAENCPALFLQGSPSCFWMSKSWDTFYFLVNAIETCVHIDSLHLRDSNLLPFESIFHLKLKSICSITLGHRSCPSTIFPPKEKGQTLLLSELQGFPWSLQYIFLGCIATGGATECLATEAKFSIREQTSWEYGRTEARSVTFLWRDSAGHQPAQPSLQLFS